MQVSLYHFLPIPVICSGSVRPFRFVVVATHVYVHMLWMLKQVLNVVVNKRALSWLQYIYMYIYKEKFSFINLIVANKVADTSGYML